MATASYRVYGRGLWHSGAGNAILAVVNKPGSGKKLRITGLEVNQFKASPLNAGLVSYTLRRVTDVSEGLANIPFGKFDTASADLPAGVRLTLDAAVVADPNPLVRAYCMRTMTNTTTLVLGNNLAHRRGGLSGFSPVYGSVTGDVQPFTLAEGEGFALDPLNNEAQFPYKFCLTIRVGSACYSTTGIVIGNFDGIAPLALWNPVGSGVTIQVIDFGMEEVGTNETPYFQVVPIGGVVASALSDSRARMTVLKMDTAYPDLLTTTAEVLQDVPFLPFGVPQEYLTPTTAGTPKGVSYLQTKDFVGPQYAIMFPEFSGSARPDGAPDIRPLASLQHRSGFLIDARAGLTVREGEGVALVSAAETGAGVERVGYSGQMPFDFAVNILVDNAVTPTLNITGIVAGSRVAVYRESDGALIGGSYPSGTSVSFNYDFTSAFAVTILIVKQGYVPFRISGFTLTGGIQAASAVQIQDRTFNNP
jgi:hypothetical protein